MKYQIEIKTDNAAFNDYPGLEVARILKDLAGKAEAGYPLDVPLYDLNGNKVGFCKIIEL